MGKRGFGWDLKRDHHTSGIELSGLLCASGWGFGRFLSTRAASERALDMARPVGCFLLTL